MPSPLSIPSFSPPPQRNKKKTPSPFSQMGGPGFLKGPDFHCAFKRMWLCFRQPNSREFEPGAMMTLWIAN